MESSSGLCVQHSPRYSPKTDWSKYLQCFIKDGVALYDWLKLTSSCLPIGLKNKFRRNFEVRPLARKTNLEKTSFGSTKNVLLHGFESNCLGFLRQLLKFFVQLFWVFVFETYYAFF